MLILLFLHFNIIRQICLALEVELASNKTISDLIIIYTLVTTTAPSAQFIIITKFSPMKKPHWRSPSPQFLIERPV